MINDFPNDEMHLLDLGCMKKMLLFTVSGKFTSARISKRSVQELSYRLEYLRPYVSKEMARKPRGLNELVLGIIHSQQEPPPGEGPLSCHVVMPMTARWPSEPW